MAEVRGRYPAGLYYCLVPPPAPPADSPEGELSIAEATPPLASLIARTLNVRVNAEVGRSTCHCYQEWMGFGIKIRIFKAKQLP